MKRKKSKGNKEKRQFLKIVKAALKEDLGKGDITTDSIVPTNHQALGVILPKQDGVLCGIEIARMVFKEIDERIDFQIQMKDGSNFPPGMTIASVIGPAGACLKGERTALNFLQHLSGIATLTKKFVDATQGRVKILDTRKTLPGLRIMEKYAVRIGGGHNHRMGLYDMVLIKDNHIEIAGSITNAVGEVRKKRKKAFIEVEIQTHEQLKEALALNVNRVMLDNMTINQINQATEIVHRTGSKVEIELSGGMKLDSVEDFAVSGVDYISIGMLTHSAPAIDIAMQLKSLGQGES